MGDPLDEFPGEEEAGRRITAVVTEKVDLNQDGIIQLDEATKFICATGPFSEDEAREMCSDMIPGEGLPVERFIAMIKPGFQDPRSWKEMGRKLEVTDKPSPLSRSLSTAFCSFCSAWKALV